MLLGEVLVAPRSVEPKPSCLVLGGGFLQNRVGLARLQVRKRAAGAAASPHRLPWLGASPLRAPVGSQYLDLMHERQISMNRVQSQTRRRWRGAEAQGRCTRAVRACCAMISARDGCTRARRRRPFAGTPRRPGVWAIRRGSPPYASVVSATTSASHLGAPWARRLEPRALQIAPARAVTLPTHWGPHPSLAGAARTDRSAMGIGRVSFSRARLRAAHGSSRSVHARSHLRLMARRAKSGRFARRKSVAVHDGCRWVAHGSLTWSLMVRWARGRGQL